MPTTLPPRMPPGRIPQDLYAFAATRTGEYLARYREILAEAFSRHTMLLNAKQLREVAGGGSQTTAQRAIDEFRVELGQRLSHRVRLGADVPHEVVDAATALVESMWAQARDAAAGQFEADREQLRSEREEVERRLSVAQAALEEARRENLGLSGEVSRLVGQVEQLRSACEATRTELESCKAQRETEARQAQAAQAELERSIEEMAAQRDEAQAALAQARDEASRRFDRMLLEHREAIGAVQRSLEGQIARQRQETQEARSKLEEAIAREAAATMKVARSAEDIAQLGKLLEESRAALLAAQEQARAEVQAAQAARQEAHGAQLQLIEVLRGGGEPREAGVGGNPRPSADSASGSRPKKPRNG